MARKGAGAETPLREVGKGGETAKNRPTGTIQPKVAGDQGAQVPQWELLELAAKEWLQEKEEEKDGATDRATSVDQWTTGPGAAQGADGVRAISQSLSETSISYDFFGIRKLSFEERWIWEW